MALSEWLQMMTIFVIIISAWSLRMAIRQDVLDLITAIDDASNKIAARIDALVQASTGLTAEEKAAFKVETDKLNALGADPANPIPPA